MAQHVKKKLGPNKRRQKAANGGIELLLIQSVADLGHQGDVVTVKRGYADNFLIPQGLACDATDHHKRMVDKHKAKLQQLELKRTAELRSFAAKLGEQSVTIEANATEDGHLYGSVGAPEISSALKKNNITVNTDQIRMDGVIKELGLYTVKLRLSSEVEGEVKVWVVPMVGVDA